MPVARRVVRITSVREIRTVAESFAYDTDGAPWELEQAAHDAAIRGATRLVGQRIDTFRQDMADPKATAFELTYGRRGEEDGKR